LFYIPVYTTHNAFKKKLTLIVGYGFNTEKLLDAQDLFTCPAESSPTTSSYA